MNEERELPTCKVPGNGTVENDEDSSISHFLEEHEHAHRSERNEDLEIEEEGGPCGWLMFRDGGNNRNVLGSISGIQKSQGSTGPASDTNYENKEEEHTPRLG